MAAAVEPDRITAHVEVTTHVTDGLASLPHQLRGREKFEALLTTYLTQVQALESAAWSLYALGIDESSNHALDQIGAILGATRPAGLSDASYRWILKAVVIALTSSGTVNDLIRAMRELMGGTSLAFDIAEVFPADLVVEPVSATTLTARTIHNVLERVKAGGVGLQVVDVPSGDTFAFSTLTTRSLTASARGFSDTSGASGGQLVGVVE